MTAIDDDPLAGFSSERRLFELEGEGELAALMVEAWSLREGLNEPWELRIDALSPRADLALDSMPGRPVTLLTTLADGSRRRCGGMVTDAGAGGSDGGLARYSLTVRPWLSVLQYTRRSQVWQAQSFVQIVESVFSCHAPWAAWRWTADTTAHLGASPFSDADGLRRTTTQYRETDLAFVSRLFAEEGLVYRFEADPGAPLGHRLVILADTSLADVALVDAPRAPTSAIEASRAGFAPHILPGAGAASIKEVRFHRASSAEKEDAVQAFGVRRTLQPARSTVLGWDDVAKRAVAASVASANAVGGPNSARLEHYDPGRAGGDRGSVGAGRAALLQQQTSEARETTWLGRGTERTFHAGLRFRLTGGLLDEAGPEGGLPDPERATFLLTRVVHAGVNNLPRNSRSLSRLRASHSGVRPLGGPAGSLASESESSADGVDEAVEVDNALRAQALQTGYANSFEAVAADVPWRPALRDAAGAWLHARPTANGLQTAIVVGAGGEARPVGADEIHTDALGRIRIRFAWQTIGQGRATSRSSAWVRVLQRYAGPGVGLQFIPRIGQEVLVDFLEGDIDRPLVVGALHDGRGEGGVAPTPGGGSSGERAVQPDRPVFGRSTDHRPAGQGNLSGGHSPAWHGASPQDIAAGGQNNAAALSGVKSKEFGGDGFNQLVFDDSPRQLRTQLATTQHATQLNLGHLVHQADNHRGSFRGLGFELRTDAYGSVRAKNGLLISSHAATPGEAAGDDAAGIALVGRMMALAARFDEAARVHQTVRLGAHVGTSAGRLSRLDAATPPLQALHMSLGGKVSGASHDEAQDDARRRSTGLGAGRISHALDPVVAISARAALVVSAGQDLQMVAGEGIALGSGRSIECAVGGASRLHTVQAIGMLGGASAPGSEATGTGLTVIAGGGDVELQAQADALQVGARDDVTLQSRHERVDWAAAKKITLSTAGGAAITIEGGNVTVQCPGKITIRAGIKSFSGPQRASYELPSLPRQLCIPCLFKAASMGSPFALK